MTDYIKNSFINVMKNILINCNNIWEIKNKIDEFINCEWQKLKLAIDNKNIEIIKNYGENIRLWGAKNKMAQTIIQKYNLWCVSTIIFCIKSNAKNKFDRIIPIEYLTNNIINKISINETINNLIKPFKKYFDYKIENSMFEKYNFTNDKEMIKIRIDKLMTNGTVWKIYNEIYYADIEQIITKNKNSSYNEIIINNINKLYFDIEYEDNNINISDFILFLNTEILIGFDEKINIHIATASKPNKLSYHIVCDVLCSLDYNITISLIYNKKYYNICDTAIYAINKSLRMINTPKISHKLQWIEHRPFKIISNSKFADFLFSYTENINNELKQPYIYNNEFIHTLWNCEKWINNFDLNKTMNILNNFLKSNNITFAIKQIKYNYFHILTLQIFNCPICNRPHESDNLFCSIYNNILNIGCYRNKNNLENKFDNIKLKINNDVIDKKEDQANIF